MKGIINSWETADGMYMVSFNDILYNAVIENVPKENISGSWNVLPARILGISYADYLRYARDKYNGTLYGKNHKYPIVKFKNENDCKALCKELLLRWTRI